jgi:hypothetical protein
MGESPNQGSKGIPISLLEQRKETTIMRKALLVVLVLAAVAAVLGPAFAFAQEPMGVASATDMLPAIALVASGALALLGGAVSYAVRRRHEGR